MLQIYVICILIHSTHILHDFDSNKNIILSIMNKGPKASYRATE